MNNDTKMTLQVQAKLDTRFRANLGGHTKRKVVEALLAQWLALPKAERNALVAQYAPEQPRRGPKRGDL